MTTPTREYMTTRIEQANAAIDLRDGELLVGIINLIHADGYGEFATLLTKTLVEQGLTNLMAAASGGRT